MDIDSDGLSTKANGREVVHNVSMDGGSTPKKNKKTDVGPIFDEAEFGPGGQAPKVQESALVNQIKQQKK